MKALMSAAVGGPQSLELLDVEEVAPKAGEISVDVAACAINFPDALIIEDKYQFKPERPFAPGGEISGTVRAIGEGVEGFAVGDTVIASIGWGGLREQLTIEAARAYKVPEGCDPVEGSGLLFTYGTNMHGLIDRGELKEGETLLVLGAAGGIGIAAIEIGKALGARVVGAVSTEEKAEAARQAGADDVVVYGGAPTDKESSKALADMFKAAVGPGGADVIYDPVGGAYAEPALRSIAWEGRYCVVGFPAGIPRLPLNLTLLKSCDVRGVFWGGFAAKFPDKNRAHIEKLIGWWKDGKVKPLVQADWTLADAGDAITAMADRKAIGKLVVKIGAA